VVLEDESLYRMSEPLIRWYQENKRSLPWRDIQDPYRIWVSEIMLQQTRVEAVKPYYERFLRELPDVKALAEAEEDKLLKLWEGLGYYNRVRNMQKAAQEIMVEHGGEFPCTFEDIRRLTGIGNYTAGAIGSFAFGIPKPAVDGNVLRVVSRVTENYDDIMKQSVRTSMEQALENVMPKEQAGDFNQGLIELGAIVCVPNGAPKCEECPLTGFCKAYQKGVQEKLPVKSKAKSRRIEKKTILVLKDGDTVAIRKRGKKGLLAGLYEFPNLEGHLSEDEVIAYCKEIGLSPLRIKKLAPAKHIFSHIEWEMIGYRIRVDELEKSCTEKMLFVQWDELKEEYAMPSAFEAYVEE
jgi:A/G-specific adenine glycosylase